MKRPKWDPVIGIMLGRFHGYLDQSLSLAAVKNNDLRLWHQEDVHETHRGTVAEMLHPQEHAPGNRGHQQMFAWWTKPHPKSR